MSLGAYTGFTTNINVDDLKRLCWVWEWDGKTLPSEAATSAGKDKAKEDAEENPFLDDAKPAAQAPPKDWTRGAMGIVISQATHRQKSTASRVPVYGIGIEVEMDIDKDMKGGMAAVARWTGEKETRRKAVMTKLRQWVKVATHLSSFKLHEKEDPVPPIPTADLPSLPPTQKPSNLTRLLASSSPKSPSASSILAAPQPPGSPTRSTSRSPSKSPSKKDRDFAVPFPATPSSRLGTPTTNRIFKTPSADRIFKTPTTDRIFKTPSTNRILFPKTPSSRHSAASDGDPSTPTSARTPSLSGRDTPTDSDKSVPSTPVHQRGPDASTVPQTPTSSRRQALYERVRQRSLQNTPTKANPTGASLSKDELFRLGQEEMRRRLLLGRLSGIAESVWMYFSNPAGGATAVPTARKRRALPAAEVAAAVVKSSPVPLSIAETQESLGMLTKMCPFFLRELNVSGEEWLEMPEPAEPEGDAAASSSSSGAGAGANASASPRKGGKGKAPGLVPKSPSKFKTKDESVADFFTRSPRQVWAQGGGLREVRERIRRELESIVD
ncbi:hypothetical protein GSI_00977 [Ganoderma sinense ZZ0214-1]|uniref:DNA replication factor Cdt1 C-terminal domain-containing protein n=1 Tax=Ganoderma sinense ZZ0214-1 TaxID=1077348 RepID=A0A2G8SU55_9APHY|nr:hypothetical protein GSI_00977 [Ganoderma sinense ZZ0214-1]